MNKYRVWEPVLLPNQPVVDTRWIFRPKYTESGPVGKARLVARGFMSTDHNETHVLYQ